MATREEIPDDNTITGVRTPEIRVDEEETGTPKRIVEISSDLIHQEDI